MEPFAQRRADEIQHRRVQRITGRAEVAGGLVEHQIDCREGLQDFAIESDVAEAGDCDQAADPHRAVHADPALRQQAGNRLARLAAAAGEEPVEAHLLAKVLVEIDLDELHFPTFVEAVFEDGVRLGGERGLEPDFHAGIELHRGADLLLGLADVLLGNLERVIQPVALLLLDLRAMLGEFRLGLGGLEDLLLEFLEAEFLLFLEVGDRIPRGVRAFP